MLKDKINWSALKGVKGSKKIETPVMLWELFCDYAESIDDNPSVKHEVLKGGDRAGTTVEIEHQRPYTWAGFYAFLFQAGVLGCIGTLMEYKSNRKGFYDEYQGVIERIDKIMYAQKFEGATTGHFSAVIIARDLGLAEKREIEEKQTRTIIDYTKLSDEALEEIAKASDE